MAKGARASTRKANNQKLKARVFGPVETARMERLSAKLMELVAAPKPSQKQDDVNMDAPEAVVESTTTGPLKSALKATKNADDMSMEIDGSATATTTISKSSNGRIQKRNSRKSSIVFPKYKNGKKVGTSKSKKR